MRQGPRKVPAIRHPKGLSPTRLHVDNRPMALANQNAFKHGLSTVSRHHPRHAKEVLSLAGALCEGETNSRLFEQALAIAEAELLVRWVCAEEVAAIERLRDPTAVPFGRKDPALAQENARFEVLKLIGKEHDQYPGVFYPTGVTEQQFKAKGPPTQYWFPEQDRTDWQAFVLALPELRRCQRYKRRALSSQKRALGLFMRIKGELAFKRSEVNIEL